MAKWTLAAACVISCLPPAAASAQAVLGAARSPGISIARVAPAPSPEPPPAATDRPHRGAERHQPPGQSGDDLFRAGPRTYAPRYDERSHARRRFARGYGVLAPAYVSSYDEPAPAEVQPIAVDVHVTHTHVVADANARQGAAAPAAAPPAPEATIVPALPKTLYVIPRCYAGDKKPDADQLRPGCALADLRVIPAGTS